MLTLVYEMATMAGYWYLRTIISQLLALTETCRIVAMSLLERFLCTWTPLERRFGASRSSRQLKRSSNKGLVT